MKNVEKYQGGRFRTRTVINAKSELLMLHINFDYESILSTIFNTTDGIFKWLHLPFGVKFVPEICKEIPDILLTDMNGIRTVMDAIPPAMAGQVVL